MRLIESNNQEINHVYFNLTLVRHAETNANAEGTIQGTLDTELSDIGYKQAKVLGQHLQYHRFTHIYSSDLRRASETARQIQLLNRVSSCEIKFHSLLRERIFGIAQGRTRQWLSELAKEYGIPYHNFTPTGAETTLQVRERAIKFFRKLCEEIFIKYGAVNQLKMQDNARRQRCHSSMENLCPNQEMLKIPNKKHSLSTETILNQHMSSIIVTNSCRSPTDSVLNLSSILSYQKSKLSSSILSYNSTIENPRTINKQLTYSKDENHFSNIDILVVSHGAVIRELIKYFVFDLHTDIGQRVESIQELAPNASITRFQVKYSINKQQIRTTTLHLIDYHNKTHLINANNNEYNLDTHNRCSL